MAGKTAQKAIDEIKNYLFKYDKEAFYGPYKYNRKDYPASNLLFSLLISERLDLPFKYYENPSLDTFQNVFKDTLMNRQDDKSFKKKVVKFLKEINDVTDQVAKLNTITFSFHDLLTDRIDLSDIKESLKKNLNDYMIDSLDIVDKAQSETMERFKAVNSPLYTLVASKGRGNKSQIAQEFLSIGYKVDNNSNILHKPIINSFLDGISSEEDWFTAAIGARNALIQGTNAVADSGYLNRKLCFGTIDISLSDENDCKSNNYLEIDVTAENYSVLLPGRFINEDNQLKLISFETAKNYIGKHVQIRSPYTCKCKTGICKTCYGLLSKFNKGLVIGIIAATSFTEIATQKLLSTKHLISAVIHHLNESIFNAIEINHDDDYIKAKEKIKVLISHDQKIYFTINGKTEQFLHNFRDLTIKDGLHYKKYTEDIEFTFEPGDIIFTGIRNYVNIDMNALMATLNRVFNRTGLMQSVTDMHEYFKYILEMSIELGYIPSVHLEVLFSHMIRCKDKHHLLWRHNQDSEYDILSIGKANLSNSLFNNILFERVSESILNLNNYKDLDRQKTKYEKLFNVNTKQRSV